MVCVLRIASFYLGICRVLFFKKPGIVSVLAILLAAIFKPGLKVKLAVHWWAIVCRFILLGHQFILLFGIIVLALERNHVRVSPSLSHLPQWELRLKVAETFPRSQRQFLGFPGLWSILFKYGQLTPLSVALNGFHWWTYLQQLWGEFPLHWWSSWEVVRRLTCFPVPSLLCVGISSSML